MKQLVLSSALFALGTLALSGRAAAATDAATNVCIADASKQALVSCNVTGLKEFNVTQHGNSPQVNFTALAPGAEAKKRSDQLKPSNPTIDQAPRDERKSRLEARQEGLLVTEIQGIERLYDTTPKTAADRPTLMRRLAEDYVELESAAFRKKIKAEIDRDTLKKTNASAAGQKQTEANSADNVLKGARTAAIKYYTALKTEYPRYPQIDEVLYYLAYEYEQASDYKNARTVYFELINTKPDSKYVPNAYLAFGELFFNEAQGDPSKWSYAEQAYDKVTKYKPPENRVFGYAYYKLGYVYWNMQEFEKAMTSFKRVIEYGVAYSQLPGASKIADAARKDMIPVYAIKGDASKAYNFFKGISGDSGGSSDKTYHMMDELGLNYLDTGHYDEAIVLYKDLMARDRGGRRCVYQAHIVEATMALKSSNKDAIRAEIDNQLKTFNDFKNSSGTNEEKFDCANKTAALVTETAMSWHIEAVGTGPTQKGTNDQKTMTLAAYLYKKAADNWNAAEFSKFEFPRIKKEDWPTIYKIKYRMADLLYSQEKWAECGPAFDSVVAENPNDPDAQEAAYASVLCYQKIYEQQHAHGEQNKGSGNLPGQGQSRDDKQKRADEDAALKPKEMTAGQKGMLNAFNKYLCYIKPAASDSKGQDQLIEVKFARARTYFEAQHWEEAGAAFREIALQNADKDVGIYAAKLYLESINVLGMHSTPRRPTCYDDMGQDVPKFLELYCTGDKANKNADQCLILNKVQVDLLRLKAQNLVKVGDDSNGGPNALQNYHDAGDAYFEMFKKYCQEPVNNNQPAQADKCDEIAYNGARAYQAARLIGKAIAARKSLIDYDNKSKENSPLAKKAVYEVGGNYQAIAVYDVAAEWFERFAKEQPGAEKADQALSDAVILRLGLGQDNEAIEDDKVFTKNYGAKKPAQTASIKYAIGSHYADKEDWGNAVVSLQRSMSVIANAAPDIQVQAHAALGRSLSKLKKDNEAKGEFAKVRAYWKDPNAAIEKIKASYPNEDDAQKERRVGRALTAVGEGYFAGAEELKHASVDPLKFPEYKGSGTKEDVTKHINTKVSEWLKKKIEAINKTAPEYEKIVKLEPQPPPKWAIAAGSRVGLMWGDFVDDFRKAPIPKAWEKDPEIRGAYFQALDEKSEPLKSERAKPALVDCLKRSLKFQYFDEYSRSCELWLAKNYKGEYHVVDELRGAPTLSNSGLDEKAPPILIGGTFWRPTTAAAEKVGNSTNDEATSDNKGDKPPAKTPKNPGPGVRPKGPRKK